MSIITTVPNIDRVRQRLATELTAREPAVHEYCQHISRQEGKMLRPALVLGVCDMLNFSRDSAVDVAAAAELIHIASCVHDDVLDRADRRRRLPTVNYLWGNHAAVMVGDYLFARAFCLLAQCGDPKLLDIMASAIMDMCEGETQQLAHAYDLDLDEPSYMNCISKKTASLIAACCTSGAALAGASDTVQSCLDRFGRYLGIAFQITDDILDFVGHTSGKPLCTDISQGLMTLPLLRLNEDRNCRQLLEQAFTDSSPRPEQITAIRELVVNSGVLDECRTVARQYMQLALGSLSELNVTAGSLTELTALALNRVR